MELERDRDAAAVVAEAAHASSTDVADTIHDAIEAHERSGAPVPAVGRLLEEASVEAQESVGRTGWLRGWFRRVRGRAARSSCQETDPLRSRPKRSTPSSPRR